MLLASKEDKVYHNCELSLSKSQERPKENLITRLVSDKSLASSSTRQFDVDRQLLRKHASQNVNLLHPSNTHYCTLQRRISVDKHAHDKQDFPTDLTLVSRFNATIENSSVKSQYNSNSVGYHL